MSYPSIQFTNSNRCIYKASTPSFLCVFALIFLFVGYIGLSYANSGSNSQANWSGQEKLSTNSQNGMKWVKGRLLITPRAGLTDKEMKKILEPQGVRPQRHLKELNVHICDVAEGVDEAKLVHKLKKDSRFKNIELDMVVEPNLTVTDPEFSRSWAPPKIGADTAWDKTNGEGVIIAILDTGVNSSHPDLAANIVDGWNTFDNNADSSDVHGHGTKVAGSAAAAANNAAGSVGVSWGASIMPIRVADKGGFGYYSTIAAGIRWAADYGARVANASFRGLAASSTIKAAADYMRSKGGVVVVSAGNTGALHEYAASDSLLVASATNSSDVRPSWSSYGPYVDVAAPGVGIYTTTRSGGYGYASGTSFSSPITAATIALMLSVNNELTPVDLDQIIKSTAVDLGAEGFDNFYGAGRIDAAAAVAEARALITVDDQAPLIAITSPARNDIVSGIVPIDIDSSDNVGVVRVELYVNDQLVTTDGLSPFAFVWDTTEWADGEYVLTAKAFDAVGNESTSAGVMVTVGNTPVDSEKPSVEFIAPTSRELSEVVQFAVNAKDNVGVVRVDLFLDEQLIMSDNEAPFSFSWDTTTVADGDYTLTTQAFDDAGNVGVSASVIVTVQNVKEPIDTVDPVITDFNLEKGMRVRRRQAINISATDNVGVAQIALVINGKQVAVSESDTLSYSWYTRQRGSRRSKHTITTVVTDQASNSASKTVTVHN